MRASLGIIVAGLILALTGAALCDTPVLSNKAFVDAFNQAAVSNHVDKAAKFERCRRFSGCQYRISDQTIIMLSGKTIDDPIKKVVVMTKTSAKGLSVKDLFSAEDNAALSLIIQVLNPELSSDQRADFVNKFATTIKDDQSSFTTKIGTNRYFAGSAPDLGIWLVASVNSPKSEDKPTWAAKWRQRIGAWIKKERGGAPAQ